MKASHVGSLARRPDGRWRARYRDPDGRERAKHFSRKADGERFLAMIESSKLRGTYVDPSDRTTVAEYARRWAWVRPYRPSTARRIDSQIRLHVENTFLGSRRMASVLPSDVQAWVTQLAAQLAPSTVELTVNMLKAIFAAAVLDRVVGSSPVVRLALPKADRDRVVPLTVDQVLELAETVPTRTRAMVLTQAGLGLRLGELLALRQQDVSFLGRTARVEHQLEDRTRARVDPKTPRSRRSVPLPQFVADALARHMQQWPPLEDGSLFYGHKRRPYHHAFYGVRTFKVAVKKLASEEGSTFPPSTTTHDLRHHYASVLLAGGESVVAVAERLGHDDASMVLKVYGHLMPDSEDRTRKIIDAAWSAASTEVISVALGDPVTDSARTERGQSS